MKSLLLVSVLSMLTQAASAMSLHCDAEEFFDADGTSNPAFVINKEMTARDHQGTITYSTSAIQNYKGARIEIMALGKNMMTLTTDIAGVKNETIGTASANILLTTKDLILAVDCTVAE